MSIRADSRTTRRWAKQIVLSDDPPSTAAAAMVLLVRKLFVQDKSRYSEWRMLKIRKRWMKEQVKNHHIVFHSSTLHCKICGRGGLDPFTKDKNKLATLDHITNICDGGSWNDPNNFQIACHQCNSDKNKALQKSIDFL